MSNVRGTSMTVAGLNLLAKCMTGKELHFTRVVLGDGELPVGIDIKDMTAMVHEVMPLPIVGEQTKSPGIMIMNTRLNNSELTTGFIARETGVFARDPDTSEEILYAYRNTGDYSEYVPTGAAEPWDIILNVVTVVAEAANITVEIAPGIAYTPLVDFNNHVESTNPHPNFLQLGAEVDTLGSVFVGDGDHRTLNWINRFNLQQEILGDMSDIPLLNDRLSQVEREQVNIALQLEAENMMPDCNMLLTENFVAPNMIDNLIVKVTSCAAGDDSVDVENNQGIIVGSWYWITDGVHAEYVQVKSVIKNGTVNRIILTEPLVNTFDVPMTSFYRTTAWIHNGMAYGSGDVLGWVYNPDMTWSGRTEGGTAESDEPWQTGLDYADNFTISGDVEFNVNGLIQITG